MTSYWTKETERLKEEETGNNSCNYFLTGALLCSGFHGCSFIILHWTCLACVGSTEQALLHLSSTIHLSLQTSSENWTRPLQLQWELANQRERLRSHLGLQEVELLVWRLWVAAETSTPWEVIWKASPSFPLMIENVKGGPLWEASWSDTVSWRTLVPTGWFSYTTYVERVKGFIIETYNIHTFFFYILRQIWHVTLFTAHIEKLWLYLIWASKHRHIWWLIMIFP